MSTQSTAGLQHTWQQRQQSWKTYSFSSGTPYSTYGTIERQFKSGVFMWKFVIEALRGFCHLHSVVWFSAKLLPRMRVNYPHGSNAFLQGCLFLWCLCWHAQINEVPHTHKSNTVIRESTVKWQKCSWISAVFAAVCVCMNAYWLRLL